MTGTVALTDTSDMIGVHAVFRDAFGSADRLLGGDCPPDAVADYFDAVLGLLDAHHEGEDELLTPRLVARCSGTEVAVIQRVAAQHGAVSGALDAARDRLAEYRATPDAATSEALRAALADTVQVLVGHLDDEEREILPIAARHISPAEWGELPGHALRQFDGDQLWFVLGLVFDHMTDGQRANAQAHMPPPLLQAWHAHGRAVYAGLLTRLGG